MIDLQDGSGATVSGPAGNCVETSMSPCRGSTPKRGSQETGAENLAFEYTPGGGSPISLIGLSRPAKGARALADAGTPVSYNRQGHCLTKDRPGACAKRDMGTVSRTYSRHLTSRPLEFR